MLHSALASHEGLGRTLCPAYVKVTRILQVVFGFSNRDFISCDFRKANKHDNSLSCKLVFFLINKDLIVSSSATTLHQFTVQFHVPPILPAL